MLRRVHGVGVVAVAAVTAVAGQLGLVATAPAAHADGTHWVRTATAAAPLGGATPAGAAPTTTALPVTVSLASRDEAGLQSLLAGQANPRSPEFHHYLTPAQFAASYGAAPAEVASVVSYLGGQGLTDIHVNPGNLTVDADATTQTAARAFNTTFGQFSKDGRTMVANTAPALVPSGLAGVVTAVVGLNTADRATTFANRLPTTTALAAAAKVAATKAAGTTSGASTSDVTPHSPTDLATIYDAAPLPAATGTTLAVLAEGNLTPVVQDLRTAESYFGIPQVPVTVVPTGSTGSNYSDTANVDEWDLDSQSSTGMAGNVNRLFLYDTPNLGDDQITQEIIRWVSDDAALVGTASYGLCDSDARSDGMTTTVDAVLKQAQAQGQAFFASSGDTGASCPTDTQGNVKEPSYPASSTYATGVGGTTLTTSGTTYTSETTWNDASGASGGGTSSEARPSIATTADQADITDFNAVAGTSSARGVPDMAMDGSPQSGAEIVVNNQLGVIGGTSLSSPLAAGAWARLENSHSNTLGAAAPDLYGLYNAANPTVAGATPGLNDITSGNNAYGNISGYSAHTGYDLTTGLGTFDVASLSNQLDVAPTITAASPPTGATVSTPYSYTFTATGSPQPTFVASGTLPPGLALAASGALTGTPTRAGTYSFTVTAGNGVAPNATTGTITVNVVEPTTSMGDAVYQGSAGNLHLTKPIVGMAVDPATGGYWLVASDGGIFSYNAPFFGSTGNIALTKPIVGMAATPDGGGYYLVASDGGIFAFGDAHFQGSTGNIALTKPVVGMAIDPKTGGYWLDASDGGIFAFNAPFLGSAGALRLTKPVVGMAATADGGGYYLDASDGGIFTYGDARFQGSTGNINLTKPVVGMAVDAKTGGYWLVASDGGIFAFDAPFYGSAGSLNLTKPVVGMAATPSSLGYYLVASDGGIFTY